MKKFKLAISIATMCLALMVLCFGVYSATNVTYNIGGSISYEVTDVFVEISTKVYSVAGQTTESDLSTNVNDLASKTFTELDAQDSGYTLKQTLQTFTTDGTTQDNKIFDAKDSTDESKGVEINFNNAYTYYVVVNIKNLSPSKNVFAYISNAITLGEDANTIFVTNNNQDNIAQGETKNIVLGFSLENKMQSIANGVTFSCPIKVDYKGQEKSIPEGMSFSFDDSNNTATVSKYSGTDTKVVIPSTISKDSNGNAIAGKDYTVTSIGMSAFENNQIVTSIEIPKNITSIYGNPFSECTNLTSIIVDEENKTFTSGDKNNYIIDTKTNTLIFGLKTTIIPESVTRIGDSAFAFCTGLTSIIIPSSVTSIGGGAFIGCTGLTSIIIPKNVKTIEDVAFKLCTNLKNVTISTGVETIMSSAFEKCKSLTDIEIPRGITSIDGAFMDCTSLKIATLPISIKYMQTAFGNCTSLRTINYAGSESQWNDIHKDGWNAGCLENMVINYNYVG